MENISTKAENNIINIPLIKNLHTGQPLMSQQNIDNKYVFSGSMFKGFDMFMLPVLDNHMEGSAIVKGDNVIVSRQNVARNGEIVVALIGNKYLIARLYKQYDHILLKPDSKTAEPIYAEKVVILGKVVGVVRNEIN